MFLYLISDQGETITTNIHLVRKQVLKIHSCQFAQVCSQPSSIKLVKTVAVNGIAYAVCKHANSVLVALGGNGVNEIDSNFNKRLLPKSYMHNANFVTSTGENIIVLNHPWEVYRLSADGSSHVSSWSHTDSCSNIGTLLAFGNQIVVPSRGSKLLVLYSMDGTKIREIHCPELSYDDTAICDAGGNSVAVSTANQVMLVNIETGSVLWRNNEMGKPGGVTGYNNAVILVGLQNCVWILDIETGKKVYPHHWTLLRLQTK